MWKPLNSGATASSTVPALAVGATLGAFAMGRFGPSEE